MATSDAIVLAATIGTPTVAAIAVIVNGRNSRGERESVRAMARDQREHDQRAVRGERAYQRRSEVYQELLRYLHLMMLRVDRTEPILGPQPDPPDSATEEEAIQIQVTVSTFGSREVTDKAEEFVSKVNGFFVHAGTYRAMRDGGADFQGPAEQMHTHRQQAGDLLREIERMVRDELAAL